MLGLKLNHVSKMAPDVQIMKSKHCLTMQHTTTVYGDKSKYISFTYIQPVF